jgi:hypothetical protein
VSVSRSRESLSVSKVNLAGGRLCSRGRLLTLEEIIAPHARHEIIVVLSLRDFLATVPAFAFTVGDLNAT